MVYLSETEAIKKLKPKLKEILLFELAAGNSIKESCLGGFGDDDWLFIFLDKPFNTELKTNMTGIKYVDINDRHYWKSEYVDATNKQTLACGF